jgi:NAD(P)-dependent dehydrogenase (short-subunit alcohol dehydrogenase family)
MRLPIYQVDGQALVDFAVRTFGRIDALFNNAELIIGLQFFAFGFRFRMLNTVIPLQQGSDLTTAMVVQHHVTYDGIGTSPTSFGIL